MAQPSHFRYGERRAPFHQTWIGPFAAELTVQRRRPALKTPRTAGVACLAGSQTNIGTSRTLLDPATILGGQQLVGLGLGPQPGVNRARSGERLNDPTGASGY
jgi:hypothetical protein